MKNRVVVTGIGVISPFGIGKKAFWEGLKGGKSAVDEITIFDTSLYRTQFGAEVKALDLNCHLNQINFKNKLKELDRTSQYALIATKEALRDSNVDRETIKKAGIIIGALTGAGEEIFKYFSSISKNDFGENRLSFINKIIPTVSDNIVNEFNLEGPQLMIMTACAAGIDAIGYAFDLIRNGSHDLLITGGSDIITEAAHAGFSIVFAITKDKCRPFDKNRSGFVLGEGSGILILESMQHALDRKAKIYAEIVGYGASNDAYHPSAPDPNGEGATLAINFALKDAGLSHNEIDYINAHGTATRQNDLMETKAIKNVFGDYAYKIPISSIKSMIGHTLGASGSLGAIATIMAFEEKILPPTINYEAPDPECDLDYIPNKARQISKMDFAMSNSFGFGGCNASIIFKRINN